jgi:DNA end-binding protein Ku
MAARAIWTGVLKIESNEIPVKLFSAVQDRAVHFNLLDKKSGTRVKQHMVNPNTDGEVPRDEIRKGYETEPGLFVLLTPEEVATADPEESREIRISRFLPPDAIVHQYYERPYYLGPDGEDVKPYFALSEALANRKREGLAHWVMRKKEYNGALRVRDGYLVLITLRNAGEVVTSQDLPALTGRAPDPREIQMGEQLISVLADDFRPEDHRDEYRDRVMQLIENKAKGNKPKLQKMPARAKAPTSLLDMLSASLEGAKKGKGGKVA